MFSIINADSDPDRDEAENAYLVDQPSHAWLRSGAVPSDSPRQVPGKLT